MKQILIGCVACLFLTPAGISAEGFVAAGTGLTYAEYLEPALIPQLAVEGGLDFFVPIGAEWSYFFNCGAACDWFPTTETAEFAASLSNDISYMTVDFFSRLQASTFFQYASGMTLPYWYTQGKLYLSLDLPQVSLFGEPTLLWEVDDGAHTLGIEGDLGLTMQIGSALLEPVGSAGVDFLPNSEIRGRFGGHLEFDWYPAWPVNINLKTGIIRRDSSVREVLITGTQAQAVDSYTRLFLNADATVLVTQWFELSLTCPANFRFMDQAGIADGSLLAENEYQIIVEPEIGFTLYLDERWQMELLTGLYLMHSNSTNLNLWSWQSNLAVSLQF